MKRRLLILSLLVLSVHAYCQKQSIEYTFPEKVATSILRELSENKNYDTSKHMITVLLSQNKDTVICQLVPVIKKENSAKRSLLPIAKRSDRYLRLNSKTKLPIVFYSDLHFSKWPTGLHGSFFQLKFNYAGDFFGGGYE